MFSLFQAFYRVSKADQEAKNASSDIADQITQDQMKDLNDSVKRVFENNQAYIIVNKNEQGLYDIEFNSGIKGPINYVYFSRRFLGLTCYLSKLKSILTEDFSFYRNNEIVKNIRERCRHIDATKIDITLHRSDDAFESYYGVIRNLPLTFVYSSKYLVSDIIQIMTFAPQYPAFKQIEFALSHFGDSYFSLNNILSFILAEMDNKDDYYAVASGVSKDDKIQTSEKIHDELVRHKIINHQDRYHIKKEGIQPGIILYNHDEDLKEQRTFIKRIDPKGIGLYEMMVLQISKECECVVPDIQVVISPTEWCMLSKDISHNANDVKQTYQDLSKILLSPDAYLDTKNYCIYSGRQTNESFTHIAYIDKLSVAKIILISIIFNLIDVNLGNVGFRFRKEGQQTTAEFTLLDFQFNKYAIYTKNPTINEMVAMFVSYNNFDSSIGNKKNLKINSIEELCKGLTTEDYAKAFQSIKDNFESAHALATTHSRKFMKDHFQSELRFSLSSEKEEPGKELMHLWAANFKLLNEKLHNEYKPISKEHLTKICF